MTPIWAIIQAIGISYIVYLASDNRHWAGAAFLFLGFLYQLLRKDQ